MTIGVTPHLKLDHEDALKAIMALEQFSELSTTISFAPGAGGSNQVIYTVQVVDAMNNPIAGVYNLAVYFSTSAVGANLTGAAYSGGNIVPSVGALLTAFVAGKYFDVITDPTGKFVAALTDTAKSQGQFMVIPRPRGDMVVSGPTVTASFG